MKQISRPHVWCATLFAMNSPLKKQDSEIPSTKVFYPEVKNDQKLPGKREQYSTENLGIKTSVKWLKHLPADVPSKFHPKWSIYLTLIHITPVSADFSYGSNCIILGICTRTCFSILNYWMTHACFCKYPQSSDKWNYRNLSNYTKTRLALTNQL